MTRRLWNVKPATRPARPTRAWVPALAAAVAAVAVWGTSGAAGDVTARHAEAAPATRPAAADEAPATQPAAAQGGTRSLVARLFARGESKSVPSSDPAHEVDPIPPVEALPPGDPARDGVPDPIPPAGPVAPAEDEPAAEPAGSGAIPSPAELVRQMRETKEAEAAKLLIAQIDLGQPMVEQPAGVSLFGPVALDLKGVVETLQLARENNDVRGVLLTFYNGGMMNLAQAQEIRQQLDELRRAGKRTFVYADSYDTVSYLVASAATDVVLMDGGEIFVPGVAVEPMFFRGTLDLLGVKPDFVQIGEYKGAEEPYVRTEPSDELGGEMNKLVDALYGQLVSQISAGRNLSEAEVRRLIDEAMIPARVASERGLVDHLVDADGLRDLMAEELGEEVRIDDEFGREEREALDPDNPFALFAAMTPKIVKASEPSVAVVYAEGAINSGESGGGGLMGGGGGVGSETIRRAMRMAERDDNVKAVVIRIDSPGGSALASEAMYQAVRRVAEKKPVVISIGGMAASGGYYLAVAGDHIMADPVAIVGSIGVVGGKMVLGGLYEKLGLNTVTYARGRNADLFGSTSAWDDRQKRLVRAWMRNTYDQFTSRVMSTRGGKIKDIDEVARGRIFLAKDALALGMVDELGGYADALAEAAERAGLGEEYEVLVLPGDPGNPFAGAGFPFGQAPAGAEAIAALKLMPPHVREALGRLVDFSTLLAERPVVLITPYHVRLR